MLDDQNATLAWLERPETYGPSVTTVERIDTHVSSIFLAGERAFKLKRAVRFSYLDFSTVVLREASARAELALNARTAPDLYLAVRAIARAPDGRLAFDGIGEIVDWAIEMQRFEDDALFERISERGALDDGLVGRLAVEIARFHEGAERTPQFGGRASLKAEVSGNVRELALASTDATWVARCAELDRRWQAEIAARGALLDRRAAAGKIRRCHGDLHLRNIVLWHGRPTLFDCIEFNERLSCIDVLYDLAFFLMDLRYRGRNATANLACNAYLDRNDESDGVVVLPLMMSLRAAIRAHTGMAAAKMQHDVAHREAISAEARAYLELAERLLDDHPLRLVAIGGLSGSGKTTLARTIAAEIGRAPGACTINTDAVRKRLAGVAPTERLESDAYAAAASARVYLSQRERASILVRAGCSTIVDGVFARLEDRAAIAERARAAGVSFVGIWLLAPGDTLRSRVASRRNDSSDATLDVVELQLRASTGENDWVEIDAGGTASQTLERARAVLARSSNALRADRLVL